MPTAGHFGNQPDFAAIYGDDATLTPRLAAHLWAAALFLSDTYREDPHSEVLRQELPPVAQRLAGEAWIERFVSCFKPWPTGWAPVGSSRNSWRRAPPRRWRCTW